MPDKPNYLWLLDGIPDRHLWLGGCAVGIVVPVAIVFVAPLTWLGAGYLVEAVRVLI